MKKKRELAYSRALVPKKLSLGKKIIITVVLASLIALSITILSLRGI